jgi:hypothetical protein
MMSAMTLSLDPDAAASISSLMDDESRNVGDLVVTFEDTNVGDSKEEGVKNASDVTARKSKVPMKKNILAQVDWVAMATFCLFCLFK